ncbi:hypothetical protein [Sinomicrobium sp. M5D2P17]
MTETIIVPRRWIAEVQQFITLQCTRNDLIDEILDYLLEVNPSPEVLRKIINQQEANKQCLLKMSKIIIEGLTVQNKAYDV